VRGSLILGTMLVPDSRWGRSMFFLGRVWGLLRGDRSLMAVAAIATVLNVVATAIVFGGVAWMLGGQHGRPVFGLVGAVFAFPATVVSTYCNVALLRMAQARFEGRHCGVREGFAAASRRLPAILRWSLLATGVGVILSAIAQRIPFFGVAWSLATMFAIPVLAIEDVGARTAARRSVEIFRARWGEGVIGQISVTFATGLLAIPGVALLVIGITTAGVGGLALAVVGGAIVGTSTALSRAVQQLYALAIYRHEVLGRGAFDLAPEQLDSLVNPKRRKGR
jgi:hypothetical protein